jgi:hypothetical protein
MGRRTAEPVGEGEPGALPQAEALGGRPWQRHFDVPGLRRARQTPGDQPYLRGIEGREVRQVGVGSRTLGRRLERAREGVRAGAHQGPYGHRQPVEGRAGLSSYGGVGGRAPGRR